MKLLDILKDIFPFLRNAMEKFWNSLPDKTKDALIDGAQFNQILKSKYKEGYEAVVKAISEKMGLDVATVNQNIFALAKIIGWDIKSPEEFIDRMQAKVDTLKEDPAWDSWWYTLTGFMQIIFTGGRMNWAGLAIGLTQFVHDRFIKNKD